MNTVNLNQFLNTILATLRYYQAGGQGDPFNRSDEIHSIATNEDDEISMDAEGIDTLCYDLNTGNLLLTPKINQEEETLSEHIVRLAKDEYLLYEGKVSHTQRKEALKRWNRIAKDEAQHNN